MKNSSNKFRGKDKEYKKNSDFGYYSKNTNRLEKMIDFRTIPLKKRKLKI